MPILCTLNLEGLKINDAERLITDSYKTIIKNPIIYLTIIDARPTKVTITGEVVNPGFYELSASGNESTIVQALKKAGGVSTQADIRNITIKRFNNNSGKMVSKNFDFWSMLNGNIPTTDPVVYDGDIIKVENKKDFKILI